MGPIWAPALEKYFVHLRILMSIIAALEAVVEDGSVRFSPVSSSI